MTLLDPSTRPYLLRAIYEWCADQGFTPYIVVLADDRVQVPREYVRDGQIVLNVGADAVSGLKLGNELIEFKARFGGVPRELLIPVDHVLAIYARESGQGMAFPPDSAESLEDGPEDDAGDEPSAGGKIKLVRDAEAPQQPDGRGPSKPRRGAGKRTTLKRIK